MYMYNVCVVVISIQSNLELFGQLCGLGVVNTTNIYFKLFAYPNTDISGHPSISISTLFIANFLACAQPDRLITQFYPGLTKRQAYVS